MPVAEVKSRLTRLDIFAFHTPQPSIGISTRLCHVVEAELGLPGAHKCRRTIARNSAPVGVATGLVVIREMWDAGILALTKIVRDGELYELRSNLYDEPNFLG